MADFNKKLKLLQHFMSDWAGEPADAAGLVRILNPRGSRPPLIWCFNGQNEFPMLAGDLGPDQPVIALRSLNLVARFEPGRLALDNRIADHYAELLLAAFDLSRCSVGGNCQGAPIAARIAANLLRRGCVVETVICMEWPSLSPLPIRCGLIFGAQSTMFNPFLQGLNPEPLWRALFADHRVEIIPGGHGEYFSEANHAAVGAAVARLLDAQWSAPKPADGPVMTVEPIAPPPSLPAASRATIKVAIRSTSPAVATPRDRLSVGYVWISGDHGPSPAWGLQPAPRGGSGRLSLKVETPGVEGAWDLYIFPTQEHGGPISWLENHMPKCRIAIEKSANDDVARGWRRWLGHLRRLRPSGGEG